MAYYIGTKTACEAYNNEVTQGEEYNGATTKWSEVIRHATLSKFCIKAHKSYPSNMTHKEILSSDWYPDVDL